MSALLKLIVHEYNTHLGHVSLAARLTTVSLDVFFELLLVKHDKHCFQK